jgi:hypothetical protein
MNGKSHTEKRIKKIFEKKIKKKLKKGKKNQANSCELSKLDESLKFTSH